MTGVVSRASGAAREVEVRYDAQGAPYLATTLRGAQLLRHPLTNKGAAFDREERRALGLEGLLPPAITTLEQQVERAYAGFGLQTTALGRHLYLRGIQDRSDVIFQALLAAHLEELLPYVYTPTVAEAIERFDHVHQEPKGLVITYDDIERIDALLAAWPADDVRVVVATDASAILGIGDRGHGGIGISIGKLSLYGAAGVDPARTMPVLLDAGTDRDSLREDPLYQGVRRERARGQAYLSLVDAFVGALARRYPRALLQWEDLAKDAAIDVLHRHRRSMPSFNDDVQGTGAVALAGLLAACAGKGERLRDQRVVIHGAGAGGAGVAMAIQAGMRREGLSDEEARARVLVLDSRGLLIEGAKMEAYKAPLAQRRAAIESWKITGERPDLLETVREGRATVLIGLSGQAGAFDETIVKQLGSQCARPIVLALSNPITSCEARPADVLAWTEGRAIVATGSPFAPVELGGKRFVIGQGNNAFVFPGIGLGAMLSGASEITDQMVLEAAYALAEYVQERHLASGAMYPPIRELREVSAHVAARVMRRAVDDGVGTWPEGADPDPVAFVRARSWTPRHLPVRPA
ncbi:oxaloacetate-decarboxylating malate dehydrogenase [Sandaracinus amylolyticus]|uniref:NAD-dependent malic enzyme n=1 Tax=Sandaracinus amylolyticus TaxID=927083 RepID=A0A0F6W5N5_9BACT|nr:NAD-dependent malic enzyme [Sandaracinus amylolyticus]